jgi:lysophospholipase L1-like esterase
MADVAHKDLAVVTLALDDKVLIADASDSDASKNVIGVAAFTSAQTSAGVTGPVGVTSAGALVRPDGAAITSVGLSVSVANLTANGSAGTAATTVDIAGSLVFNQTTASITATLAAPTATSAVRTLVLVNNGTASLTVTGPAGSDTLTIAAGRSVDVAWRGADWRLLAAQVQQTASGPVLVAGGAQYGLLTPAEGASVKASVAAAWKRPLKPRNKAARIFAGRTGTFTTNASGTTFSTTMAAPRRFDAFQVVLHNAGASAIQIDACSVVMCSGANTDSLLMGGGQTIVNVTFDGGSATSTIGAAATNRRTYKVSDIVDASNVEAVDRGDGGSTFLINARHYTAQAAASISVIGNGGSDTYTNWRTASNGRIWLSRQMNGNQTATAGSAWSTTDISQTTIAGFIFYCEGQVVSIGAVGDSVAFGFGSTRKGAGVMEYLADYFNVFTGVATSTINIARSGASTDEYKNGIADLIAAGIVPDVMLISGGTVNDLASTLAAGNVRKWRRWVSIQMSQCWDAGCVPVVVTVAPVTSAVKALAATDALRIAHNADLLTWRARGQPVIDLSTAVGGAGTGTAGQIEPPAGMAPDGTHPNDAAYAAAGEMGAVELAALFVPV